MSAQQTAPRPIGSTTTTTTSPQPVLRLAAPSGTLRLRAEPTEARHIQWAEDVVDNEGMGKKSSKVCCIYHKPREVGDSSDESSSDSSSSDESDSEVDDGAARPAGARRRDQPRGRQPQSHDHEGDCEHIRGDGAGRAEKLKKKSRPKRQPSPNAYEKMPKSQK